MNIDILTIIDDILTQSINIPRAPLDNYSAWRKDALEELRNILTK